MMLLPVPYLPNLAGRNRPLTVCLLMFVVSTLAVADNSAWAPLRSTNDLTTRKGFEDFYNLEYDKSIKEFETVMQAHPDDPFVVNHVLSAVIFKELYKIGALDTEAYATDSFLNKKYLQPLDPKVHEHVNQLSTCLLYTSPSPRD